MNRSNNASPWLGLIILAIFSISYTPASTQTVTGAEGVVQLASPALEPSPLEMGDALMLHQRYQAAIEAYRRAPGNSAEALNKMGVAYQLMQNVNEASRCYQKALKLSPHNPNFINNLASIYMEHKEYSRAVKMFRKAARLQADSALFEKNLGTALLAEHKYDDGWKAYQRAVALDPEIFSRTQGGIRVENPATIENRGAMNFYLAKGCVKAGLLLKAVEYLRMTLNEGFTSPRKVMTDVEFEPLRDLPEFQKLMAAQTTLSAAAAERNMLLPH